MNKNTLFICYTIFFLFLFDFLFFGTTIWQIPNESPWNTNHFYNFIYEWKKIEREPKTRKRIFVVGSSIAYYSMDKVLLQKSLSKSLNEEVDVEYFSYAGKSPLYLYLFLDELWKLKPDFVIYPINFIDFRLHRAQVLQPGVLLSNVSKDILERDAISAGEAPQAKIIFPWQTLTKMWNILTWEDRAEFFLASIFRFYAYKDIYAENISNLYNHRFGRNTRYHGYAGVQIPKRVNSLGWTGKEFSFSLTKEIRENGIWIEVVPEILQVGALEIQLQSNSFSETISLTKSGWVKISLNQQHNGVVTATLSHTWSATTANSFLKDYHRDRMGVRLTQTFGLEIPSQNAQYSREERTEDLRYIGMSDSEYEEYFYFRLLTDLHLRPGIRYLVELANSKKKLAGEDFAPILHFHYLKLISEEFADKKIPLLIINNPENPISLDWYKNSNWYNGYLEYLSSLQNDSVGFIDLKENLPMQDFSDYHHFTYPGMVKMNTIYTQEIVNFSALKKRK